MIIPESNQQNEPLVLSLGLRIRGAYTWRKGKGVKQWGLDEKFKVIYFG
jgi:hypothetical protein